MTAPLPFKDPPGTTRRPERLVRLEAVTKTFPGRGGSQALTALNGIDLSVSAGSVMGVIGRSGAGKSTLIRLINGLEKPTTGRVFVGGMEISGLEEPALRDARRSIGMIFQHFNLLSVRTAAENVALPLELARTSKAAIRTRVDELLELVGLADKRDSYPAQLSGGQKQRIGIARALATRPKLLLSDEATSALDPGTTRSILDLLGRINRDFGLTILLITHEMSVIRAIAREVAVMDAGCIVEHGAVFDIFARPHHAVTRTFLAEETGRTLPPSLQKRLRRERLPHGQTIVRITFRGAHARDPIIAHLAQREGIAANIIAGAVDEIRGKPFGNLVVGISTGPETEQALRFFAEHALDAEVIGYVA